MTLTDAERSTTAGAFWALAAAASFSANDVLVKFLASDYPLYQLMFVRSTVGMLFIVSVILPLTGPPSTLLTKRLGLHLIRGGCVVFANFCFFLGLASLPLANAVALFFISPLIIAVFSVVFLGETVGPRRWAAIFVGLIGVVIVVRPGTSGFQIASLLPLAAAFGYATLHILTRRIGGTENATAMAFYIQVTFFFVACIAGLALGDGKFDKFDHASLSFLFSAWVWPTLSDFLLMSALGVTSATGGYLISQAYRRSEAALVAPFEYTMLPLAVFWGLTIFDEWPDRIAWVGIVLIMASGLIFIWREAVSRRRATLITPKRL
ncbi:MAG: DMT family transporter [Boseongicola sp.]